MKHPHYPYDFYIAEEILHYQEGTHFRRIIDQKEYQSNRNHKRFPHRQELEFQKRIPMTAILRIRGVKYKHYRNRLKERVVNLQHQPFLEDHLPIKLPFPVQHNT